MNYILQVQQAAGYTTGVYTDLYIYIYLCIVYGYYGYVRATRVQS